MPVHVIRNLVRRLSAAALPLCLLGVAAAVSACDFEGTGDTEANAPPDASYDSAYAAELGADDYGMARYVMAFLRAGPNRDLDSATAAGLQRAHLDNIIRMAEEKDLLVAGPFLDDGELRGIYIFDVETVEEARALTKTDPAVQQGLFEMELHPWYGPAAMRALYDVSKRVQKQGI